MGLISVIAGAIITSVPLIFLQYSQRKWYVDDEKRQWRRDRLLRRLSPIQDWLDDVLRFTQAFSLWFNQDENKEPADFLNIVED
jgi:hypothetical protein